MHIPLHHHRRIVLALSGVIVLLAFVSGWLLWKEQIIEKEKLSLQSILADLYPEGLTAARTPFLTDEEIVIVGTSSGDGVGEILPVEEVLFEYIEVIDGCGAHFGGECLNVRSGPGTDYPVVTRLRDEVILKVGGQVERNGRIWYKVVFDEWLRYPERIGGDWYVAADYVRVLLDEGDRNIWDDEYATTSKKIIVSRQNQKLYAYENGALFMEEDISTGLELTPTPRGTFAIFKKTPSRYMQGPIPGITDQYYDMPGVPWNLYFTHQGAVIHGAYWHESFGTSYSHGCVNLPPDIARTLYDWADLGTQVIVE